ncbi:cyclic nucleotide-binding domain-containing protein [bacterium]|nr:cyclic nucleotide-binding domain-containing protein [bacterium]
MSTDSEADGFIIWGADENAYGPVELPALIDWLQDDRVTPETWIYSQKDKRWQEASKLPELQIIFGKRKHPPGSASNPAAASAVNTGGLRRVKILAALTEDQLVKFTRFMEFVEVRQWADVVQSGQIGDAMYLILEGELRVRIMVNGKEKILATLTPGEFCGEISLFDHGPRSADVVANMDSKLLKISASAFDRLIVEAPELAAPIVHAIGKTLVARIRADNKRLQADNQFRKASAPAES